MLSSTYTKSWRRHPIHTLCWRRLSYGAHFPQSVFLDNHFSQDQTVKVAEARDLESELKRLREENVDLRKRVNDFSAVETAKKKVELKVEQLEQKVGSPISSLSLIYSLALRRWRK